MSTYLAVRTDKPEAELYLYINMVEADRMVWTAHRALLETIHVKISELLDRNNLALKDINGIAFYKGPGSFTGLRIGASVVNAVAAGLEISVVGCRGENWLQDGMQQLPQEPKGKYILPDYGSEAFTTPPKK